MEERFIFVIETDKYAGNFERQMCGYLTGKFGECGVGEEEAREFLEDRGLRAEDSPFDDFVESVPDEDGGCRRPCSTWGRDNKSVAIFFYERPTDELISIMRERAKMFGERENLKIKDFKLLKKQTTYTEIGIE